ncbi:MAG TPA: ubiquitin-like small modifier protein 1 [Candidatus Dormibacteraeota bacterium]|nr:ubiquitin-like small modifier protein 1 [Candidatus Dormibacteraeota bacterium]
MPRFRIPGPLRRLSNGEITVEVGGADLGAAIVALDERYPGFRDRLLDDKGDLRQFVNVYLNDEDVRLGSGLDEKVKEDDEISIVPAVAGGASRP